ncbi:endoribonuclease L-PSP [Natrialba hulunbeirensis JCM 10989]|uniref:Endoribonuclease L-PSP n=1 Tax=Natrialba hulunbeirensis JCM 10989 TaxID=1227493 RepID=L9ZLV6_9EURY|nr:RidA family protein [Natrialba hulunbeirensis]ELY87359.1 endoribonuclease L-PSP [Natrialba hulunbeirensis JCM 10989]
MTVSRASNPTRRQRDGTAFVGGFGKTTGDSDLLFVEGQLPERDGTVQHHLTAPEQLERCLATLESKLAAHGSELEGILQVTIYVTDMDSYDEINAVYERHFQEPYPSRTTVGVCDLLGGAAVTLDAVVALE